MIRSARLSIGILLTLFGVTVIAMLDKGVPERARLADATGQIATLEKTTSKGGGISAIRLSLSGNDKHFQYLSKAGHINEVWQTLEQTQNARIRLLFDPADSHSPAFDERVFYNVFEIAINEKIIRSQTEVSQAWDANNVIGELLGFATLMAGLALLLINMVRRPTHQNKNYDSLNS